jgi:regulator of cell morphogenesis and NO signaling
MKVREIALQMPQAARVFEKLKIDYCCGGDLPLADACATAGVDVSTLERMLAESATDTSDKKGAPDFPTFTLAELSAHILEKHHVYTKEEMARLEPLMGKVLTAHGENHKELATIAGLFRQLCAELKPHMFKEEQILFPYIVSVEQAATHQRPGPFAPFGTVNNPVRMMMMEHDTAGEVLREMRKLSADYTVPADACMSYQTLYQGLEALEHDLHQHIHLENNILFPRAIEMEGDL